MCVQLVRVMHYSYTQGTVDFPEKQNRFFTFEILFTRIIFEGEANMKRNINPKNKLNQCCLEILIIK